jgi:hypothetical protein
MHFLFTELIANAKLFFEDAIGDGRLSLHAELVLRYRCTHLAACHKKASVHHECLWRTRLPLHQLFEQHKRSSRLALFDKGPGEPNFQGGFLGSLHKCITKFLLSLSGHAVSQQRLREVKAQRNIVG